MLGGTQNNYMNYPVSNVARRGT